jgi:hypothetical protein
MASIVFDDTFEVNGIDNEKFDNVSRIKAKVCRNSPAICTNL